MERDNTAGAPELLKKEYELQGKKLKWREVNFQFYRQVEKIKADYSRFEQRLIKIYLSENVQLKEELKEIFETTDVDEFISVLSSKDNEEGLMAMADVFRDNPELLSSVIELTVQAQTEASEEFILEDKKIQNLISVCLDTDNTNINYNVKTLDECEELMTFARNLLNDFFLFTKLRVRK